jgi:hypothetical protein
MAEWQPIDTAPRDGRQILLYQPEEGGCIGPEDFELGYYIFAGRWVVNAWYCTEYEAFEKSPSHWQPLPEPPNG